MTKSTPLRKVSESTLSLLEQSPLAEACRDAKLTSVSFSDVPGMMKVLYGYYRAMETPTEYHKVLARWRQWKRDLRDREFERELKRLTRPERQARHERTLQRKEAEKPTATPKPERKPDQPMHHRYGRARSPLEKAFRALDENLVPITRPEHDRVHDQWRAHGEPPYPPKEEMVAKVRAHHMRTNTMKAFVGLMVRQERYEARQAKLASAPKDTALSTQVEVQIPRHNPQLSRFGAQVPATAY